METNTVMVSQLENEGTEVYMTLLNVHGAIYFQSVYYFLTILVYSDPPKTKLLWSRIDKPLLFDFVSHDHNGMFFMIHAESRPGHFIIAPGSIFKDVALTGVLRRFSLPPNKDIRWVIKEILDTMPLPSPKELDNLDFFNVIGVELANLSYASGIDKLCRGTFFAVDEDPSNKHHWVNPTALKNIQILHNKFKDIFSSEELLVEINKAFTSPNESDYIFVECIECKDWEIYHKYEIANGFASTAFCRNCLPTRYSNLKDVPYSSAFCSDLLDKLGDFSNKLLDGNTELSEEARSTICRYIIPDSRDEYLFFAEYLSRKLRRKNKYNDIFDQFISKFMDAPNAARALYNAYHNHITSKISRQISQRIHFEYSDLANKIEDLSTAFIEHSEDKPPNKELLFEYLDRFSNLYKDVFDLVPDHYAISNIAQIIKREEPIDLESFFGLFGQKLLRATLSHLENTDLFSIITELYDSKIRNAIAHPARFYDKDQNKVVIFDKGKPSIEYHFIDYYHKLAELLDFHFAIESFISKCYYIADWKFHSTGGILSIVPTFFASREGILLPCLVINQNAANIPFAPNPLSYSDLITIDIADLDCDPNLVVTLTRKSLDDRLHPQLLTRKYQYGITEDLIQWIIDALENGGIYLVHQFCYVPIDRDDGNPDFTWDSIPIPVFCNSHPTEIFVQPESRRSVGSIKLDDKFYNIIEPLVIKHTAANNEK